jgi:uncharacterized Fe-S center protein
MSDVFLLPAVAGDGPVRIARQVAALWDAAGLEAAFGANDLTALKLHVGEPGRPTFVSPDLAAALVERLKKAKTRPFLTDTVVLYKSPRDNGIGHIAVAADHGFTAERVGAPFLPADGLDGSDGIELPVDGRHFETVFVAGEIVRARSMLVLTHATGHLGTGLGGAIKNLGMGCCSRKGKLQQHHGQQPHIVADACTACGNCADHCPSDAIEVDEVATIDQARCVGCGECLARCHYAAVGFAWTLMGRELQERMAEHAAAVVRHKPGRICYLTAAQQITKDCDCLGRNQPGLVDDIGLLASFDPVAIDQAVLDLVAARAGCSLESMSYPEHDGTIQLARAAELGIGSREYRLVEIDPPPA